MGTLFNLKFAVFLAVVGVFTNNTVSTLKFVVLAVVGVFKNNTVSTLKFAVGENTNSGVLNLKFAVFLAVVGVFTNNTVSTLKSAVGENTNSGAKSRFMLFSNLQINLESRGATLPLLVFSPTTRLAR